MSSTTDATTRDEKRAALLASIRLLVFPILSGFALAFSYPPQGFRFLAWVALVPLGLALRDRRNWPELYVGLYLGGLAFHLIHLDWIRSGTGATWLSGPRATQWLAQGTLLALAWPLALGAGRLFIHRSRLPTTLALPLVWTAFEYARRYYWAIFDATGYPYGQLALTQAHHAWLIQIADITGAHGVTAVIAAVNGLAIDCIHWVAAPGRLPNRQLRASAVGVATMLIVVWSYGAWRLSQQAPRVGPIVCLMPSRAALTSVQVGAERKVAWVDATSALVREQAARNERAEIFLWSEGAYPGPIELPDERSPISANSDAEPDGSEAAKGLAQLERFAHESGAQVVMGCDRKAGDGRSFNSAAVVDPRHGYLGAYDKMCLVPFVEFWPRGRPDIGPRRPDHYAHGTRYPVFSVPAADSSRDFHFAATICYDICFPEVYRRFMRARGDGPVVDFFVVPSCESHDKKMRLQRLLLDLARFRAVECRRAILRNVQGGFSGIIDGNGSLVAAPDERDFKEPANLGRVPIDSRSSFYAIWGDWLPIAACAAVVLWPLRRYLAIFRWA